MRIVVFGASGMVGNGVLRECFEDGSIESVLAVGRSPCGLSHPKLDELIRPDLFDLDAVADRLVGYDACFYCLGVSSAGMDEAAYRRVTYDLTLAIANVLVARNPGIRLCFVSGQGTDSRSRLMWARVKAAAENALLEMPIEAYMFRPGIIQPMKGVRSKTWIYQAAYTMTRPLLPLLRRLFPGQVTTSVAVGRAMINAVTRGYPERILETADINRLAEEA